MTRPQHEERSGAAFVSRNADELALLCRGIEMAVGGRFSLFVVEAPGAREIRAALDWLKSQPSLQGIEQVVVEAPTTRQPPLDLLGPLGAGDVSARVVHLKGIPSDDAAFLRALNVQRDPLVQDLPLPLLLWVTKDTHQALREQAADFYDYRDAAFFLDGVVRPLSVDFVPTLPRAAGSPDDERRAAWLEQRLQEVERRGDNSPADVRLRAELELDLGRVLLSRRSLGRAESLLQTAAERFSALGLRAQEGDAIRSMGDLRQWQDRMDDALRCYDRGLTLAEQADDQEGRARAKFGRGMCLRAQNRLDEARQSFEEARALLAGIAAHPEYVTTLSIWLFRLLKQSGNEMDAQRTMDELLARCQQSGDRNGEAMARASLASTLLTEGKPQAAFRHFERAIVLSQEEKYHYGEAAASMGAAGAQLALREVDAARSYFRRAAEAFKLAGEPGDAEYCEAEIARLAVLQPGRISTSTPVGPARKKVGRNDPCPCGSGHKYKKCCLNGASATGREASAGRQPASDSGT